MKLGTQNALSTAVLAVAMAGTAAAADFSFTLPDGLACTGFDVQVDIWSSAHRVLRSRNAVVLQAGQSDTLLFTNLSNGRTYTVYPIGSVDKITLKKDGSADHEASGNNVVVLFPGDTPTGPSTILYTGRLVFNQSFDGVTTIKSFNGKMTDICAAIR